MSLRSWTTIEGNQRRFFVSGDVSTVCMGDWFARQGGFKTFFDKTFLERLDFFCRYFIRQWFRQKSGGDSAVRSEFVIAGMIFHPSRVKSELLHK
jgi:hypothetical protein